MAGPLERDGVLLYTPCCASRPTKTSAGCLVVVLLRNSCSKAAAVALSVRARARPPSAQKSQCACAPLCACSRVRAATNDARYGGCESSSRLRSQSRGGGGGRGRFEGGAAGASCAFFVVRGPESGVDIGGRARACAGNKPQRSETREERFPPADDAPSADDAAARHAASLTRSPPRRFRARPRCLRLGSAPTAAHAAP